MIHDNVSGKSAIKSMPMHPQSGESVNATANMESKPPYTMHTARVVGVFFSRSQRRRIEQLACRKPLTVGWQVTHWSQRTLTQAAVEQEYVDAIHYTTVGTIVCTQRLSNSQRKGIAAST
ncbi:MAG: hypothetical protein AAB571_01585, partial [Chloroflexota bacterium]